MKLFVVIWFSTITVIWCARKKGPYRSILVRQSTCRHQKPDRPLAQDPAIIVHTELYNTSTPGLCRGNITIVKDLKNIAVKFKYFYMQNGKWSLRRLYNIRCDGIMVATLTRLLNVNYNSRKCSVPKGAYNFANIDFNFIDHVWAREKEYGRVLWLFQVFLNNQTHVCFESENVIVPAPP